MKAQVDCPECNGAGWVIRENFTDGLERAHRCGCCHKAHVDELIRSRVGPQFEEASLEAFVPRDKAQQAAFEAMTGDPAGRFLLVGSYHRGKTHLMAAQFRDLATTGGTACFWRTADQVTDSFHDFDGESLADRVAVATARGPVHLFLDDIHAFKPSEYRDQEMYKLLDVVYRNQIHLTATTNMTIGEMVRQQRITSAVARRLDDIIEDPHKLVV